MYTAYQKLECRIGVPLACFAVAVAACHFLLLPTFKHVCGEWRKMQVAARGLFAGLFSPPPPLLSAKRTKNLKTGGGVKVRRRRMSPPPLSFLFFPRNNERWSGGGGKKEEKKRHFRSRKTSGKRGERRKVEQHRVGFHKANLFGKGNIGQRILFPFRNPRVRNTGKCNSSNVYEIFALNYMKPSSPSLSFLHPPSPPFASN